MTTIQINVYRHAGQWYYACFVDGEYDHADGLDIEDAASDDDAVIVAEHMPLRFSGTRTVCVI